MAANAAAALAVAGVVEGRIDAAIEALATATVSGMRMEVDERSERRDRRQRRLQRQPGFDACRARRTGEHAGRSAHRRARADGRARRPGRRSSSESRDDAASRGIEIIVVGTDLYGIAPVDDPVAALGALGAGDVVLVKASRVGGLESVAAALLAR